MIPEMSFDYEEKFAEIKRTLIQQKQEREKRLETLAAHPDFQRLCHSKNWDRFTVGINLSGEEANCPHCNALMLMDNWPPNYAGGSSFCAENGTWTSEDDGTAKYVCIACKQEVHIYHYIKRGDGKITERIERVVYDKSLTERNGKLLTKHDVWREDYREEHGEYPTEAYG